LGSLICPNFDLDLYFLLEYNSQLLDLLRLDVGDFDDDVVSGKGLYTMLEV